jgi:uncharacterized delta-60 repeat protein
MRLLVVSAAAVLAAGVPGSLDRSFGHGGRVFTSLSADDTASGVAVARDGTVLVAGRSAGKVVLVRYDARGRRVGIVRRPIGADPEEGPVRIALEPDGKIVLATTTSDLNRDNSLGDSVFAVYRLLRDGRPDPSFGARGSALVPIKGSELIGAGLGLDAHGRIVVGARYEGLDTGGIEVVRLTPSGRLDRTFGRGGRSVVRFGGQSYFADLALDAKGRTYVAGTDFDDRRLRVLRVTPAGALDRSFGVRGIATLPRRGELALPGDLAVQPDGRIVVAGSETYSEATAPGYCVSSCEFLVLGRLTSAGRPDPSFGTRGIVRTALALGPDQDQALALQPDGKIVVSSGIVSPNGRSSFLAARFVANGRANSSFAPGGYVIVDMRSAHEDLDRATGVAIAPGGKLVLAGRSARDATEGSRIQYRFAVTRLLG